MLKNMLQVENDNCRLHYDSVKLSCMNAMMDTYN